MLIVATAGMFLYLAVAVGLVWFSSTPDPNPKQMDVRYEEVLDHVEKSGRLPEMKRFRARDGARLNYYGYQADGNVDRVFVLVHGSGYHSAYLQPLAEALRDAGAAHVYTPDVRGHGPQVIRRGDVDYVGQLEDDLEDLIGHLRERHPNASCILGGHSIGGGLLVRLAGGQRDIPVDGYVLLAPFIHPNIKANRPDASGWALPNVPRLLGLRMLNRIGVERFNSYSVIRFQMPEIARDGTETLTYSYRLLRSFTARKDYKEDLSSIREDLLVLLGDRDRFFDAELYKSILKRHVPHGQVQILKDVNHLSVVTDSVAIQEINDWLEVNPH